MVWEGFVVDSMSVVSARLAHHLRPQWREILAFAHLDFLSYVLGILLAQGLEIGAMAIVLRQDTALRSAAA